MNVIGRGGFSPRPVSCPPGRTIGITGRALEGCIVLPRVHKALRMERALGRRCKGRAGFQVVSGDAQNGAVGGDVATTFDLSAFACFRQPAWRGGRLGATVKQHQFGNPCVGRTSPVAADRRHLRIQRHALRGQRCSCRPLPGSGDRQSRVGSRSIKGSLSLSPHDPTLGTSASARLMRARASSSTRSGIKLPMSSDRGLLRLEYAAHEAHERGMSKKNRVPCLQSIASVRCSFSSMMDLTMDKPGPGLSPGLALRC